VLGELRAAGFGIALDDFRFDPGWEALVARADAVKLDLRELPGAALEATVARLRRPGLYLLAEKVQTRAEYEHCRALGFDAFQGHFFA
jgi:c-di-GMP phosphodiesterase